MPRPFTITLPIADRRRSFAFYREGLELDPVGELAEDGVPEPLQFRLSGDTYLCLIPTGGFGWVLGARETAPSGTSECLLGIALADADLVTGVAERMVQAGGTLLTPPAHQPWGFEALVADPDGHAWQLYLG
ncbi:VOC family protein [Nesterenkonia sp. Act20]|uniref:VOC family protein n=1 Tax=Nesterenkonia sp. Act20 TaxID=1483432 RepID=UPI001C47E6ED|nr:VOC family protein [Nesterenkonia sp. Act20]